MNFLLVLVKVNLTADEYNQLWKQPRYLKRVKPGQFIFAANITPTEK